MKVYSKYVNGQEFCWYDSTNTLFSKCYDNPGDLKVIKVIFKSGATYLYKNVDVNDYLAFRDAESNGHAFYKHIRKYEATRIQDTDLEKLEELKTHLMNDSQELQESKVSELSYVIEYCENDGRFVLKLADKIIFSGVEGNVSIVSLFKSMGINCTLKEVDKVEVDTDENEDKINVE